MAEMKRRVGWEEAEANFEGVVMRKGVWGTEKKEMGRGMMGSNPLCRHGREEWGKNRTGNIKIRIGKGREGGEESFMPRSRPPFPLFRHAFGMGSAE